jgi:hypothetical protein
MSTVVYADCCHRLGLREPAWAAAGEILNPDRLALGAAADTRQRFTTRGRSPRQFDRLLAYLRDCVNPSGYAYKDVVQPFAVMEYLAQAGMPVLRIERHPDDVAEAMLRRGWDYPRWAARSRLPADEALLDGLHAAADALRSLPATTIAFEDLLTGDALDQALRTLYPGRAMRASQLPEAALARAPRSRSQTT